MGNINAALVKPSIMKIGIKPANAGKYTIKKHISNRVALKLTGKEMKLEFESQEELLRITGRLITILGHERYWTKRWSTHFGATNRNAMVNWQEKADAMLHDLRIEDLDLNKPIIVVIKNPDVLSPGCEVGEQ